MNYKSTFLSEEDYSFKERKYILWLFYLLVGFVVLCSVLLFTIKINDAVEFSQGEIISSSPQLDFKAPFEAQLTKIFVKEGQKVNAGDTLMIMYNEANTREYIKQKAEKEYLQKKLASVQSLLSSLGNKQTEVTVENKINYSDHNFDVQNINNNTQTLEEQYKLQQQNLATALERNKADSILYQKDMLSKMEYNAGKDATNAIQELLNNTKRELERQRTQTNFSANDLVKRQHNLRLKTIELSENEQGLNQLKIDLQNELIKANENLAMLSGEMSKQNITATAQGVVNFVYNSRQSSNIINKGDLLVSVSPDKHEFYAKAIVPENYIQYVKPSMPVHLKLDAYYHLEYGIIKGMVTYISERKENDKFYALIKFNDTNKFQLKSGYSISGEIITTRLTLFKYLVKKLFKEFDKKPA